MGLKDLHLHLKLKAFRLRRFLIGNRGKRRKFRLAKKDTWMMPISHGYHVVGDQSLRGGFGESDSDSVVVQREQMEQLELWFFGVFDSQVGDGITKYLQSHLFNRNPKEIQIRRKSKETIRKAYLGARAKVKEETQNSNDARRVGSASVMVINGDKLVITNMGDYKAVICRDGQAHHTSSKRLQRRLWSRKIFPARMLSWNPSSAASIKQSKGSELVIGTERIDSATEFVIIASTGIWQVMKSQEAVNLIRHLEDPKEAAECLAKEALTRMSRSSISCIVIRFD